MAVTASNINLGVCDLTWGGTDLGATKGGVTVTIKTTTHEIKADQTGETPLKEIILGTMVDVKCPLSELLLSRIGLMLPQSVLTAAAGALPAGTTVSTAAAIGATQVVLSGFTTNPLVVGMKITFTGHNTVYDILSFAAGTGTSPTTVNIAPRSGGSGLVGTVGAAEVVTVAAQTGTVEVRTGVNIDLLSGAGVAAGGTYTGAQLLLLHPTGLAGGSTLQDFTVFKAGPNPNFTFKYELQNERIYEVTFKGYADASSNYRIAKFGA